MVPGLSLGSADMPTQFGLRVPFSGNIAYEDLSLTFLVGEELADYLEIFNWMNTLGHPDGFGAYPKDQKETVSDLTVFVLNSAMRPIINVRFTDAFPVNLSSLDFDSTLTEVQYAQATVTFRYSRYYIETL